jgi:predicted transcriptional regulator
MTKTMISARVEKELNTQLEALAESKQRSKAFVITEALQNYVDRQNWLEECIAEAIVEADKTEHWHSHESIEKWVNSLGTENELPPPEPDIYRPKNKP